MGIIKIKNGREIFPSWDLRAKDIPFHPPAETRPAIEAA
jgi:hypothetical protein